MKTPILFLMTFISLLPSVWAQQAAYYPVIPWTRPSADNHPTTLPPLSGWDALMTAPQTVVVGRSLYDRDSDTLTTSDSVTIPGHYLEGAGTLSGTCLGEMTNFTKILSNPLAISCFTNLCEATCNGGANYDLNGDGDKLDRGEDPKIPGADWILAEPAVAGVDQCPQIIVQQPPNWVSTYCAKAIISNFVAYVGCFKQAVPNSCKTGGNPVLTTDGDQNLGDVHLIAGLIPDPLDSYFPTTSLQTDLFLPINGTALQADDDPEQEVAVLNHLPINKNFWAELDAIDVQMLQPGPFMRYLADFLPLPFPGFLLNPSYQDEEAPLFMVINKFEDGTETVYNYENECTVQEPGGKPPYKNCRSSPVAIRPLHLDGDGKQELAVLHEHFYRKPDGIVIPGVGNIGVPIWQFIGPFISQFINLVVPDLDPAHTAASYCTNLVQGELPGKVDGNPSSQAIDVNFLSTGLNFNFGNTMNQYKLQAPYRSPIVGYLTAFTNAGGGNFTKMGGVNTPDRFCVGTTPSDFATANLDGDDKPDLVVSNFGAFSLQGANPVAPLWPGFFLEAGGGMTFVKNYTGQAAEKTAHIPIAPTVGNSHCQHYIHTSCADVNGDHRDDCVSTCADGMGMHLNVALSSEYIVPDVISVMNDIWPGYFGGECNGFNPGAPGAQCPNAAGEAVFEDIGQFEDGAWKCQAIASVQDGANIQYINPANPQGPPQDGKNPFLICSGKSLDPTCPEFKAANATAFVYYADYRLLQPDQTVLQQLPANWACHAPIQGTQGNNWVDQISCDIPDFLSWICSYKDEFGVGGAGLSDNISDNNQISCQGKTPTTVTDFPAILDVADPSISHPVRRDGVYACGYNFNVDRNSEFAVYMNDGQGNFYNNYPNLHYVDMAQYNVPRIVPDIPVRFNRGQQIGFNKVQQIGGAVEKPSMWLTMGLKADGRGDNNTMGLGVWPFHIDLVDLVDKMGKPVPDDLADAVVALNNSYSIAIIASQGGWEPFKSATTLIFPATTPEYKSHLEEFLKDQKLKIRLNQTLDKVDFVKIAIGLMSGTTFVDAKNVVNGQTEFSKEEMRKGIVTLHAFPWRLLIHAINSVELPIDFFKQMIGGLKMMSSMMGGPGGILGGLLPKPGEMKEVAPIGGVLEGGMIPGGGLEGAGKKNFQVRDQQININQEGNDDDVQP